MLKISLLVLLSVAQLQSMAKGFSYIYIQGDKEVPFYVKFEDQMLPRYGKNYSIIPQLAPGPVNIQVLFQQNMYPAQKFTIVVPEDGFRGFLLLQKNGTFALYDMHQQFYLYPGNKAEDDNVPAAGSYVYTHVPAREEPAATGATTRPVAAKEDREPRFIGNIELNNQRTVQDAPPVQEQPVVAEDVLRVDAERQEDGNVPVEEELPPAEEVTGYIEETAGTSGPVVAHVSNSDCPSAMGDNEFEDLYNKTQDKPEKQKLKFLLTKMDGCYTTSQARVLAELLGNDPEKYTFLKRVYSRITDQYNFPPLENLLSTQEWRSYFRLILPK